MDIQVPVNNTPHVIYSSAQSPELPDYLIGTFTKLSQQPIQRHKQGKKCNPSHKYGISYEAPTYFLGKQSKICESSYDNPFIKVQDGNKDEYLKPKASSLRNMQTFYINGDHNNNVPDLYTGEYHQYGKYNIVNYTHSKNFSYKVEGIQKFKISQEHSKIMNTEGNFKRKKNYFGDFCNNNDVMNVYGSLQSRDRPEQNRIVKDYSLSQEELEKKLDIRRQASLAHQKTHTYIENSTFNISNSGSYLKNQTKIEQENFNSHNQKSNTEFLDGTKNSPDMNNTVSLPSIDKKQANFFLNKFKNRTTKSNKSDLNFANFLQTRQSFIDKIVPVPVVQHEGIKFLDRDQLYLNEFNNQIITGKINQKMKEMALKQTDKYGIISKEKSSQENVDFISEFEQLQQKLFRQKKAQKKSSLKHEKLVKVEREYNQGKIWFQNASSLQEKSIKQ